MTIRYERFVVQNYRAIRGPLEVDLTKTSLLPIIGVNECGKTTILQAIFAFDHYNDSLNDGRHLRDVENLYATSSPNTRISADVGIELRDAVETIESVQDLIEQDIGAIAAEQRALPLPPDPSKTNELYARMNAARHLQEVAYRYYRNRRQFPRSLRITRTLPTRQYSFLAPRFADPSVNDLFAKELFKQAPYILYFDDFRDSIDDRIEIKTGEISGWLEMLQQLFRRTDRSYSVFTLPGMEERKRKSVLAQVTRRLNQSLTREWQTFNLDGDIEALRVSIELVQEPAETGTRNFLKLDVIETVRGGQDYYFAIRDRSKGFFWFFNFVMKLEFNPKVVDESNGSIYLLDEPGSYLHASAQSKLCSKLRRLSGDSVVIYCTHSHYLLDPDIIPLSTIRIAEKSADGSVSIVPIHSHRGSIMERRSAFQPIIDALQIRPFMFDLNCRVMVIVEGIVDYYVFQMFAPDSTVRFLPAMNADSARYFVSLLIAIGVNFRALWDDDNEGRSMQAKAAAYFGEEVAGRSFFRLQRPGQSKTIVQDLFEGRDVLYVRERLMLPVNTSFDKTVASLFYHPDRNDIVAQLPGQTSVMVRDQIQRVLLATP